MTENPTTRLDPACDQVMRSSHSRDQVSGSCQAVTVRATPINFLPLRTKARRLRQIIFSRESESVGVYECVIFNHVLHVCIYE